MIRLVLFGIVAFLVVVGVLAVALFHLFGWPGLVAFPFIIIAVVWLGKIVVVNVVKRFALRLFGMKAKALKGATLNVHSIRSVPKPSESRVEAEDDGKEPGDDSEHEEEAAHEPDTPKDYVEVDATITPQKDSCQAVWEPSEFVLTSDRIKSLSDVEEKQIGTACSVEIWDGTSFRPDDPGKYPREQRLKIVFEVEPGATNTWLYYYNQPIGRLKLPQGVINI